jgi:hypothetical protein
MKPILNLTWQHHARLVHPTGPHSPCGSIACRPSRTPSQPVRCRPSWGCYEAEGAGVIELPFPPASLSGHAKGHWRSKSDPTAKHREWAKNATLAANIGITDATGDIRVAVTFYPPNHRGDRVNFPNRMKPYWDGIADALKVNDSRFLPAFYFAEPVKGEGKVVVTIGGAE